MPISQSSLIYVGSKGTVLALDRLSGVRVWQTNLKGRYFVNLAIDGGDLIATTRGEVFCLNPETGEIRWNNSMSGFGWGLISIAASGQSSIAPVFELQRQQEAAGG